MIILKKFFIFTMKKGSKIREKVKILNVFSEKRHAVLEFDEKKEIINFYIVR